MLRGGRREMPLAGAWHWQLPYMCAYDCARACARPHHPMQAAFVVVRMLKRSQSECSGGC